MLDRIADMLLTDVIDALFEVNNAGASGGGLLSSIFSGITSLFGGGQMGIARAGGIGLYAAGTPAARPGVAWVGEKGPELVRFKGGEEVIPNHKLRASNQNQAHTATGSQSNVHVTVGVTVDKSGNLKAFVQDISQTVAASTTREGLDQFNRNVLPGRVSQINEDPYAVGA